MRSDYEMAEEIVEEWIDEEDDIEPIVFDRLDMKSLPTLPSNLQKLTIINCKSLTALPNSLPPSLRHLVIIGTPIEILKNIPQTLVKLYLESTKIKSVILPDNLISIHISKCDYASLYNMGDSLRQITIHDVGNMRIPRLPESLRYLEINKTNINEIDYYPNRIEYLDIGSTDISYIKALPFNLQDLHINDTRISCLPPLPTALKVLNCPNTFLHTLPDLHEGLEELYCSNNPSLSYIPQLPKTLKILSAYKNKQIVSLPQLHEGLEELFISSTGITVLDLPSSLQELEIYNCPSLLLDRIKNESIPDYKKRWLDFVQKNTIDNCIMIKDELMEVALNPERIGWYIRNYGIEILQHM
jgi:E3 ubiquitin-protein ligase SspH2